MTKRQRKLQAKRVKEKRKRDAEAVLDALAGKPGEDCSGRWGTVDNPWDVNRLGPQWYRCLQCGRESAGGPGKNPHVDSVKETEYIYKDWKPAAGVSHGNQGAKQ